jgi:hypothetical protein
MFTAQQRGRWAVSVSRRRRLGWAIAIAAISGTAAWGAEAPPEPAAAAPPLALLRAYRLECPRLLADACGPLPAASFGFPELRLQSRWLVDAPANLDADPSYSLGEQVAYQVTHAPTLAKLPDAHATGPVELATLEVHLPF